MLIDGHLLVGTPKMFVDDLQGGLDHLDRDVLLSHAVRKVVDGVREMPLADEHRDHEPPAPARAGFGAEAKPDGGHLLAPQHGGRLRIFKTILGPTLWSIFCFSIIYFSLVFAVFHFCNLHV